jgi:hypothetical protein
MGYLQKQKKVRDREGEDGRDPTLKNLSELMPAAKSRFWRQNLKVVAHRTQTPLQGKERLHCTCAHPEQGEAEEWEKQRLR